MWGCNIHRIFVATDLVIENDRLFDIGLPHLAPLPSLPSVPHPLLLSCTLIYLKMMSNKWRVAHFFLIFQDSKCPARTYRKQSCDNRRIFSYAINALAVCSAGRSLVVVDVTVDAEWMDRRICWHATARPSLREGGGQRRGDGGERKGQSMVGCV